MIKPICNICRRELEDFGALLFSPPDENGKVEKRHICKECYKKVNKKEIENAS